MNVWANDDSAFITAEVPGTKAEDIDISVVDDVLTLSGSRDPDELEEGMNVHRRERGYGKFTRTIQLPFNVDVNQVEATFKTGVLQITLPRAEADKPKKITVKSA
jgi:HSP20 family protein